MLDHLAFDQKPDPQLQITQKSVNQRFKKILSTNYDSIVGYTSLQGEPESRKALAALTHNNPDDIMIFSGLGHAKWLLTRCVCGHGDSVVMHKTDFENGTFCNLENWDAVGVKVLTYENLEGLQTIVSTGERVRLVFFRNFSSEPVDAEGLLGICRSANERAFGLVFEEYFYFLDRTNGDLMPTARISVTDCIAQLQNSDDYSAKAPIFLLSHLDTVLGVSNLGCAWVDLLNNKDGKFGYIKKAILDMSSFF